MLQYSLLVPILKELELLELKAFALYVELKRNLYLHTNTNGSKLHNQIATVLEHNHCLAVEYNSFVKECSQAYATSAPLSAIEELYIKGQDLTLQYFHIIKLSNEYVIHSKPLIILNTFLPVYQN